MDTTAEFKFTKLGKIPADWKIEELKNISEIITGSTPKTNRNEFWNGDYMFVTPSDINGNKYMSSTERYVTEEALKISRAIPENSIMVTCIASIGKMAISKEKCMTNQQINSIIPINSCDSQYLYYYLLKNKPMLELLASQTTVPIINKSTFSKIKIMVPPLKEQQKIAEILSTVDEQIDQTDQLIEKTTELKKGLMQKLLKKGIGNTEFKQSECGKIPMNWQVMKIENICKYRKEKIDPLKEARKKYIALENIEQGTGRIDGYMYSDVSTSMKSVFKIGDTLFNKLRPYLNKFWYATFEGVCATELLPLAPKANTDSKFLYYCLQQERVLGYVTKRTFGTKMPRTSWKELKEILVPLPSLEEQRAIAEILTTVEEDIEGYQREKTMYEDLKKGLMQQLLTGKKRVKV